MFTDRDGKYQLAVLRESARRFHRHQGLYAGTFFDPSGTPISREEFAANGGRWLLSPEANAGLRSIMSPVCDLGRFAHWIAPPARGLRGRALDFEYVRM